EQGWFYVVPVGFNAIRAADLEALTEIAQLLGRTDDATRWQQRRDRIQQAFQAKMIQGGRPYDLEGLDEQPILQDSADQFVTLFGGLATQQQADLLVKQLEDGRFWTPFPISNCPVDTTAFSPDMCGRGSVWPYINWLIYHGLRRYGYQQTAD